MASTFEPHTLSCYFVLHRAQETSEARVPNTDRTLSYVTCGRACKKAEETR